MDIFVIDISGKVIKYDIDLCEAIYRQECHNVNPILFAPLYDEHPGCKTARLLNLIPHKYKTVEYLWKRVIKLFELIINYFYIILRVAWGKPDVVHFQWLPLLEVSSAEFFSLKLIRLLSRRSKIVLTIHNVYPHKFSVARRSAYKKRIHLIDKCIDAYIVHTNRTKLEVATEFRIQDNKVNVVHHGVFNTGGFIPNTMKDKKGELVFILYGNLTDYKGVDVFVESIKELPLNYKKRVRGVIAGEMQNKELCKRLQDESRGLNIDWYPYFLPERDLYEKINNSDVIVLPYKNISQSGVLLLALSFHRYIITSDLPSFKETLCGFSDDMFFKSEDPLSLAQLIMKFVDGAIDTTRQLKVIDDLNELYSWRNAALKTIGLYIKLIVS